MVAVTACPTPIFQFFDNAGRPANGGSVLTQVGGVSYPTYQDSTGTTALPNPIPLNSRGEVSSAAGSSCQLFLEQNKVYTFILSDNNGNVLNQSSYVNGQAITESQVVALSSAVTNAAVLNSLLLSEPEQAARVTPINYAYAPGKVDRYGINTIPGTTNMRAAFQAAINQAKNGGADITWGDTGPYLIGDGTNSTANVLDCTFTGSGNQAGLVFRSMAHVSSDNSTGLVINHSAYAVFDLTGCDHFCFYDTVLNNSSAIVYPKYCFLTARNSTGESNLPRFYNTTVTANFSKCILYNYSSEDGVYVGNYWSNQAPDVGTCVVWITANNRDAATSSYTTIYSGSISCTDHQFIGGQYVNLSGGATSDVFRLDGCTGVKIDKAWWNCSSATTSGRAYVYVDMTSAPAGHIRLRDIVSEDGAHYPTYGILFGSESTGAASDWVIDGCYLPNASAPIQVPFGNVLDKFYIRNVTQQAAHAMTVGGTLQNSTIDAGESLALTIGTSNHNLIIADSGNTTITTRTNDCLIDLATGGVNSKGIVFGDQGIQSRGAVTPGTPAGATQTGSIYQGSGVPSNSNGANGDFYFRTDTPGTANQRIYVKSAGAWTGIV